MARSARQSKILDVISAQEIETQEELVSQLKNAGFDVTQATISRDIKELGLIKILSENNRYKYALVDSTDQQASSKHIILFKEAVISIKQAMNLVVIRTIKGMAAGVANMIDKFSIEGVMGVVNGDDTVMIIFADEQTSAKACDNLNEIFTA